MRFVLIVLSASLLLTSNMLVAEEKIRTHGGVIGDPTFLEAGDWWNLYFSEKNDPLNRSIKAVKVLHVSKDHRGWVLITVPESRDEHASIFGPAAKAHDDDSVEMPKALAKWERSVSQWKVIWINLNYVVSASQVAKNPSAEEELPEAAAMFERLLKRIPADVDPGEIHKYVGKSFNYSLHAANWRDQETAMIGFVVSGRLYGVHCLRTKEPIVTVYRCDELIMDYVPVTTDGKRLTGDYVESVGFGNLQIPRERRRFVGDAQIADLHAVIDGRAKVAKFPFNVSKLYTTSPDGKPLAHSADDEPEPLKSDKTEEPTRLQSDVKFSAETTDDGESSSDETPALGESLDEGVLYKKVVNLNYNLSGDSSPSNSGSDRWDFPAGRSGVNQVSAGKAGHLRVYDCEASDTVEQVVLWYAERLGLPSQNRLVKAAKDGFDSLQSDTHIKHGFGYDTDNRKSHTQLVAHLSDGHAHISFLHRPDIEQSAVVTISIAELAGRTSVHVVQGPIDSDEGLGATVRQNNDGDHSATIPESQQEVVDGAVPIERINQALREVHEMLAERTRAKLKLTYLQKNAETVDADGSKTESLKQRLTTIAKRIEEIHHTELASFERVAENAGLANSEEPRFGQSSYGIILFAASVRDINANELLLFHGDWVYRTNKEFAALDSPGAGWYFRPNVDIPTGTRFVVACHQDAAEEIENVKQGYMPNSDRARSPNRPYRTEIFTMDGKPLGRSADDEREPLTR